MKNNTPDELIRTYLNGKLAADEKENFEKQLAADPQLAQELAHRRTEMAVAELLIAEETRALFREWQPAANTTHRNNRFNWMLAIAAALLLVAGGFWYFNQPEPPAPPAEKPAAPVLSTQPTATLTPEKPEPQPKPAPNYIAMARQQLPGPVLSGLRRSTTDTAAGAFTRAQKAYETGNYRKTLDLLAQTDSTRQQSADYLSAHALFQLKRFKEAGTTFQRLIDRNSLQYRYPAEWGLLMCRLALLPEQAGTFQTQLQGILADPGHPYYTQARLLQKALKE